MNRLPVLMYHNVSIENEKSVDLTISIQKFEEQLRYLNENKFTAYFVSELANLSSISSRSIVITFDDVTENQLLYAVPLLKKYKMKATFFIPFSFIGKTDLWNEGNENIMSMNQLKSIDSQIVELAHHSYLHRKYSTLSMEIIQEDFDESFNVITTNGLNVYPALAYPYGDFPKKGNDKKAFFDLLKKNKIVFAFRIGNRVNRFPFKENYEVKRIDIKGHQSLFVFKLKLIFGKLRLF